MENASSWSLLLSIIDKPRQAFEVAVAYPRWKWVLPMLFSIIATVAVVWITVPHSVEIAHEATIQQLQQSGMSQSEIDSTLEQTARFQTPGFLGLVGSVTGVLFLGIVWLAMAGLFYFISLVIGTDELNFPSVFNVVAWASIPLTVQQLVQGTLIGITGKFPFYTGLAALQASGDIMRDSKNPLIALLSFADIFWLWHFVLLVVGIGVATKFSRTKSILVALIYSVLSIGLTTGIAYLGAR